MYMFLVAHLVCSVQGSLKSISLHMSEHADSYFDGSDDDDDDEEEEGHVNLSDRDIMLMQLRQSLREIALHDGAKGIQDLVLNTTAWEDLYEYPEAGLKAVAIVMQVSHFCLLRARAQMLMYSILPVCRVQCSRSPVPYHLWIKLAPSPFRSPFLFRHAESSASVDH